MNDPSRPSANVNDAFALAKQYTLSRQCANGGFCFYRCENLEEPNVHDTFHAIAALALLHVEVPRAEAVVHFLATFRAVEPNAIYYGAFALERMGHAASIDSLWLARIHEWPVQIPPTGTAGTTTGWLESMLRILRLKRRFADLRGCMDLVSFVRSLERDGGYGSKPNLYDTYLCLRILDLLSAHSTSERTKQFIASLQVPTFGFTATRDSLMANLEVLYAGIECCALFDVPLRFETDALAFVLACQSPNGGFSRTSNALPDLEHTHLALRIIAALGES